MSLKNFIIVILFYCSQASAQVFIPHTFWRCNSTDYVSKTTATSSDFSLGTFVNTNISGNSVVLSVGNISGTYTSQVFDIFGGCSPLATWHHFDWTTTLPYGKEIPTTSEVATDYSAINTGLTTSLVQLFHLNGSGAVASSTTITATVGTSGLASNTNGTGMTYTASGKLNSALTFDGIDDSVDIAYTQTSVSNYTIAAWFKTSSAGNNVFVQDRGSGAGQSLTLGIGSNAGGCAAGKISYGLDSNTIYIGKCTSSTYNDGIWHHVVGVWAGTSGVAVAASQFTIYIDGVSVGTSSITVGTAPNAPLTGLGNTKLGRHDSWAVNLNGSLDEVAIWTRALSASDAGQLFQRGGNRVKFQFKSCTLADCSDIASWLGPNNTNATYFTEINNNTIQSTGLGSVLTTKPSMIFTNFPSLIIPTNRYFQYQTTFETDNTTFMPDITSTGVFHGCTPGSVTFTVSGSWTLPQFCTTFTVTANGAGGGSAKYIVTGVKMAGGAGGKAVKTFTSQTPLTVFTVSVGTGGKCVQTAGTGGYNGGVGGGTGSGGAAGTGSCSGGAGKYGGGGGGGGGNPTYTGGGGGGASVLSLSGVDQVIAGGGGGAGSADQGTAGSGGIACSVASGYTGGAGGNSTGGGNASGGGGGGACYCAGGTCDSNPTSGGGAGGDNSGGSGVDCTTANDGTDGSVTINWTN